MEQNPIIYRVLYIPGGAGFLPSTVVCPKLQSQCFFGGDSSEDKDISSMEEANERKECGH